MKYEHVIWDWNGTLLDDVQFSVDVFNSMTSHYGVNPVSLEYYRKNFRFPVAEFYEQAGFDFSVQDFNEVSGFFIERYNSRRFQCKIFDGAPRAMRLLKKNGLTQSVLSAYRRDYLCESLKNYGLDKYLNLISGLDNILAASKEELGKAHLKMIGVPASKTILVGDTAHDFNVSKAMGVSCALMTRGHYSPERFKGLNAPTFGSFDELSDFILGQ